MNGRNGGLLGMLVLAAMLDATKNNKQGNLFGDVPDCGDPACPIHGMYADAVPHGAGAGAASGKGGIDNATRAPQYRDKPLPAMRLIEGEGGMSQALIRRTTFKGGPVIKMTLVSCVDLGPEESCMMLAYDDEAARDDSFMAFDANSVGEAMEAALHGLSGALGIAL